MVLTNNKLSYYKNEEDRRIYKEAIPATILRFILKSIFTSASSIVGHQKQGSWRNLSNVPTDPYFSSLVPEPVN